MLRVAACGLLLIETLYLTLGVIMRRRGDQRQVCACHPFVAAACIKVYDRPEVEGLSHA
jgi:hypothetical protein